MRGSVTPLPIDNGMRMLRTYTSEALAAVHKMTEGLYEAEIIDKRTLREFDWARLAPVTPL